MAPSDASFGPHFDLFRAFILNTAAIQGASWTRSDLVLVQKSDEGWLSFPVFYKPLTSCHARLQHHCRNCGEIFCNSCSDNELPLPASPKPVRVCDTCHALLLQRCSSNPTWSPTLLSLKYRLLWACWRLLLGTVFFISPLKQKPTLPTW